MATMPICRNCCAPASSGYVLKQSAPTELLQAIRAAAAGGQYLDSALTARVTARLLGRADKVDQAGGGAERARSRRCCG